MISLLAAELALLSVGRRVCGGVRRDLGLSASQHLLRRDESDGAVQRDLAVSHILANQSPRILGRQQRCAGRPQDGLVGALTEVLRSASLPATL